MTSLSVHTESLNRRVPDPLAAWLLPGALAIGIVLAAALIAMSFAELQPGSIGETVAPELPSTAMTTGASTTSVTFHAATASTASAQPSFAFGFLEFDWDPNAPGGVPGFDSAPSRDLRLAEVGAGQ